jgi:hypothetical protein
VKDSQKPAPDEQSARIIDTDIEGGRNRAESLPGGRSLVGRVLQPSNRHRLLTGGALGLVGIVAAAAIIVPLAMPHASSDSSPLATDIAEPTGNSTVTPSATTTLGPSESPEAPTASATPVPSSKPLVADGWPVKWSNAGSEAGTGGYWTEAGPDGTIYFLSLNPGSNWPESSAEVAVALDASGHARVHWLELPGGGTAPAPTVFGSDGSMFAAHANTCTWGDCNSWTLYAFKPDGSLRFQRNVDVAVQALPGPAGTLYVLADAGMSVLASDGSVRSSTSGTVCESGRDSGSLAPEGYFIRPDGRLFTNCGDRIDVYDPSSGRIAKAAGEWNGLAMGADGTVVAWRWNRTAATEEETPDTIKDIRVAIIGADGKPAAGWPVTIGGVTSSPVVGADGNIYLNADGAAARPPQVIALAPTGQPKTGWPAALPDGFKHRHDIVGPQRNDPSVPVRPILGSGGVVYAVIDNTSGESVLALDSAGTVRPGWPARLPSQAAAFGVWACIDWGCSYYAEPMFVPSPAGSGMLYVHLGDAILALADDGHVAAGWPKTLTQTEDNSAGWDWWAAMPDGGLAALSEDWHDGALVYTLTRWAPDGSLAK